MRRLVIIASLAMFMAMTALAGGKTPKMPPALKAGDKIAIISPAS